MKANIIPASQIQSKDSSRLIDQIAKRIVLEKLTHMSYGFLRIVDSDQMHEFGSLKNDEHKAVITVRNTGFYSAVAFGGSVGAGEAYFLGDWDCDNLTHLIRLLIINRDVIETMDSGFSRLKAAVNKILHWANRNTCKGSLRNIAAHYDIGNDLFELMLDPGMMYSSAIYSNKQTTLEQAARYKLEHICQKLQLSESDHLLEIGTGWGTMAIHAAKNYGCHVTTTTISKEQFLYAQKRIKEEKLEDKITLLFKDYRNLSGKYDKLVSIEMIEAVGLNNLGLYFRQCSRLIKASGIICIQAITIAEERYEKAKKQVDFIQKYIFPGGSLPSLTAMSKAIKHTTDMSIDDIEDIGLHYARTLHDWRERFFQNESRIRKLGYSDTFVRLWEFYLCYCEGGFRQRSISTVQLTLTKPDLCSN